MAIHDGVVWSRAAAKAVARGNCLGGTFGGNYLGNADCELSNVFFWFAVPPLGGFSSEQRERRTPNVGSSRSELRPGGIFVWRILIVRHQLPI